MNRMKANRVYICHTFYHVYVAVVKELVLRHEDKSSYGSDLILSTMSNDFGSLKDRLAASGIFENIFLFDEKEDVTSEEVMSYHKDRGNIFLNLIQRIKYTKLLGRLQEPGIPTDLRAYENVYVFCDSDPIGYYLNYKKIPYHALEDGLNSGKLDDQARIANRGAWKLKKFLSKCGLIFIESGYSRYCIDYEVNDFAANHSLPDNAVEVSRRMLHEKLDADDRKLLTKIFLSDPETLISSIKKADGKPPAILLTEPLCELVVRKKLFGDIIEEYEKDYTIIIKPHPRDLLDYEKEFPDAIVIKERFPMEIFNDLEDIRFSKLISVITQTEEVDFADEIVYLGLDFLDKYEAPEIHRKTELL